MSLISGSYSLGPDGGGADDMSAEFVENGTVLAIVGRRNWGAGSFVRAAMEGMLRLAKLLELLDASLLSGA